MFITKPEYAHNIINTGNKDAKFIVWSNELFDKNKPDTYKYKLNMKILPYWEQDQR